MNAAEVAENGVNGASAELDDTNSEFQDAGSDSNDSAVTMTDFEDVDTADAPEVVAKLASVKVPWNSDVEYFFFKLENQMELINITSQWYKRVVLANNLREDIEVEVKDILKKTKTNAPPKVYKVLKHKIISLFGEKEEDAFERAAQLELTGKPSALAKKIVDIMCQCDPPLVDCCGAKTVSALWRRKLPQQVKSRIAGMSLKNDFETVIQLADDCFATLQPQQVSFVAAAETAESPQTAQALEVAAVGRGRGQNRGQQYNRGYSGSRGAPRGGQRGGQRGGGAGQHGQAGQQQGGDTPPEDACYQHKRYGRKAYFCSDPDSCPWRYQTTPRPKKQPKST